MIDLKYDLSFSDYQIICKEILKKDIHDTSVTYEDFHFYINEFLKRDIEIKHNWLLDEKSFEGALEIFSYILVDEFREMKKVDDYLNSYNYLAS